jgi:transposase-like protein
VLAVYVSGHGYGHATRTAEVLRAVRERASALKITFMAIREASKKWTMPIRNWKAALNHFAILYEDRLPTQSR